jgi:hypothetical protein
MPRGENETLPPNPAEAVVPAVEAQAGALDLIVGAAAGLV